MANGEACIRCRKSETLHELEPENTCSEFKSEVRHKKQCPVLGCNGDCEETIRARDWRAEVESNRISNSWFLDQGQVYFVDLGS